MFRRALSVARRSAIKMDISISNPTIIRVNNRNYRCLHPTNFQQRSKPATPKRRIVVDEYDDEETYIEDFAVTEAASPDEKVAKIEEDRHSEEDEKNDDLSDEEVARLLKEVKLFQDQRNGSFECAVHVPNSCRGYLIGKNCSNIKEICAKTKARIDFPEMNRKDDPFLISAPDERSVLKAYLRMNELLQAKRKTIPLTHFLAIKCYNEQIRASYEKFKEAVKSKHLPQGFPESVFLGAGKMHLTICLLTLLDNVERNKAVSFMNKNLSRVVKEVLKENEKCLKENGKKFEFNIRGLDYMNDDPSAVRILYGQVNDKTQLVQKLCDRINATNQELGLTNEFRPNVKLHMTLMNTRYVPHSLAKQYKSFDARGILSEFKDFHFGTVQLRTIELLIANTLDESTGGYKSTHRIDVFKD